MIRKIMAVTCVLCTIIVSVIGGCQLFASNNLLDILVSILAMGGLAYMLSEILCSKVVSL